MYFTEPLNFLKCLTNVMRPCRGPLFETASFYVQECIYYFSQSSTHYGKRHKYKFVDRLFDALSKMQWRQCSIQCLYGNNGMMVVMGGPNRISCPFLPAARKRRKMITTITVIILKDVCKVANADQAGWPLLPPKDLYSSLSKYGAYLLALC